MDRRTHIPKDKASPLGIYTVNVPVASLRRAPKPSAAKDTELLIGETFTAHRIARGWVWGQAVSPIAGSPYHGYVGYVREKYLSEGSAPPTHHVIALSAPIFDKPDIKSRVVDTLPLNARLAGIAQGEFLQISQGYVHLRHLTQIVLRADFVTQAERLIGRPYIWGGVSARGMDCSGLLLTALRAVGRDAPRDSDMQAEMGSPINIKNDLSGLKRGDLIFWKGHIGIMRSATELLHANAHHMAVASEPLAQAVDRIGEIAGPITAIRRLPD